ncbi:hypothetical protein IWX90DRAFT_39726 [Phyllosticta citrichinensis]|uniref:Uncharacterized protein n=1 Tax=Phyllosticta citrichinensis TaxID=1130410 RepID=A0ABR1Y8M8_9PEZI
MRNSPFSISISLMLILNLLTLAALPPSQATHLALSPRQVFCALTGESTSVDCAACLGPGALYCGRTGCFDPSQSQSCCADGSACSGGDDCCGDVGLGVVGSFDGPGTTTTSTTAATKKVMPSRSTAAASTTASWTCAQSDDGDACCARRGQDVRYCGGAWPTYTCYRPAAGEVCCAGGRARACAESGTGTGGSGEGGSNGQAACCADLVSHKDFLLFCCYSRRVWEV